jgi:DNA gyrase subunit A
MDDQFKDPIEITTDRINDINLTDEMRTSFLSYAMSVIVSRALPDVRDGLKPVHRRILFGMEELGVQPDKTYKKSARIVGDVMGKYHPHGDSAIYEAMVRLAQPFSTRYPLVDGHGNFGSIDGDGAAAMRYTEARMAKIAAEMLADIKKNTIDFVDNYDGSEREPSVLPSKFPNLIVNGATGIAVGMATNIPPHNLKEVISGLLLMLDNPEVTLDELMAVIPGPDFPTGGILLGRAGLREAYETGNGSIRIRAKANISETKTGKQMITVTEIPYQVNKTRLIEKIAELAKEKRLDGITDLRDESSREGIKIVIELRRDVNAEVTLNNLYKYTPLQTSFGINMLALVDQKPEVLGLADVLRHYLSHQYEVLVRRTTFDLGKAEERKHILDGLVIALENIDAIIEIIRNAYDDADQQIIETFKLTDEQTKAILEMRLRRLSGLEREKIENEIKELVIDIDRFSAILASKEKQTEVIKEDLIALQNKYDDGRRTEISLAIDLDIDDEDLIPVEDVMVVITQGGYCKRMNTDIAKSQNRGGVGITGLKTNEDDALEHIIMTSTHDYLLFFTNKGKVYKMKAYKVPSYGRTSKGLPMVNLLPFEEDEYLQSVTNIQNFDSEEYLFFTTKKGRVKRTAINAFKNIRANGIRAIELKETDELLAVRHTKGDQELILGASNGKAIRFKETDVRPMGRTAAGVMGMRIKPGDEVIGTALIENDEQTILAVTLNGYGKRSKASLYRLQQRGGQGVKTVQVTEKNGPLVKLRGVNLEDDLVLLSNKGMMIRLPLDQISETGRATQGVRLMRLQDGHQIANIAIVPKEEEKDEPSNLEETQSEVPLKVEETENLELKNQETDKQETEANKKAESLFDLLDEE